MHGRNARRRPAQGETFDELDDVIGEVSSAAICALAPDEFGQAATSVAATPALQRPQWDALVTGDGREWYAVIQMGS